MAYVDGFVFVVKDKDTEAYKAMAQKAGEIWKAHGALEYKECRGDDLRPKAPEGIPAEMTPNSFIDLLQTGPNETVWFSYIVYESRAHRDEVNAKVMKDPAMNDPAWENMPMPFDMKRMYNGGFEAEVEA